MMSEIENVLLLKNIVDHWLRYVDRPSDHWFEPYWGSRPCLCPHSLREGRGDLDFPFSVGTCVCASPYYVTCSSKWAWAKVNKLYMQECWSACELCTLVFACGLLQYVYSFFALDLGHICNVQLVPCVTFNVWPRNYNSFKFLSMVQNIPIFNAARLQIHSNFHENLKTNLTT
jgi:hypothetical protein